MSAQSKTSTVFLEPEVKIDFSISLRNVLGDKEKKEFDEPATPKLVIDSSGPPPTGGGSGGSPPTPPPSKPPG
ncbi:MAG: hypothetical protein JF614_03975 [Acidobacteria bacterium]|nr:hypothetical protein [Acidobacteriota bacterium]